MYPNKIYVLLTILVLNQVTGWSEALRCYGASQGVCTVEITKLWAAKQQRQTASICKHFKNLHTCTMNYAAICKFSQYDKDLYQTDIVQTFTTTPYNCAAIGGNMMLEGHDDRSKATKLGRNNIATYCVILVLMLFMY